MSLPHGFIDELRDRVSLAQVVGRKVSWDTRKSNTAKGDYWAPCPFHQEKTASFHVDDRKGFYYCFGCHAKGDALGFVRETENVGFMDAVEILAREIGMAMPARDPKAQEKSDARAKLFDVMEQAVQFFRLQLNTSQGLAGREYLENRGFTAETLGRFDVGYSPDSRTALWQHLTGKGVAPDLIVGAGLAIKPDDGGTPYDRFRGRLMFPIRDARGRVIAFGGRALSADARAKYLNSPETLLFDKGRTLYNIGPAREAAGKTGTLIVAEGYLDVIALSQAGFTHAVAPLGTAITEHQIAMMWRVAPEPVLALDGDKAGLAAATRLIDIVLPLLEAGKSLRFCLLPDGLDPDDVVKTLGPLAMQTLLDGARPMVDLLWQREIEGHVFDSPERRAALDSRLKSALALIRDGSVRGHYRDALRDLRAGLFRRANGAPAAPGARHGRRWTPPTPLSTEGAKSSLLGRSSGAFDAQNRVRETLVLALCVTYPKQVELFESALEKLQLHDRDLEGLRRALLHVGPDCATRDEVIANISTKIDPHVVENLFALRHVQTSPHIRRRVNDATAQKAVAEELAKLEADRGSQAEIRDAMSDITGLVDEGLTWRLGQSAEARRKASRSSLPKGGSEAENTEKMSDYLQNLIDSEVWVRKKH